MMNINGLTNIKNIYGGYGNKIHKKERQESNSKKVEERKQDTNTAESKLSTKAQEYLKNLREKYKDYDFIIEDDINSKANETGEGNKEYSVFISKDEIEKMAMDEEYSNKILGQMEAAIDTSKKISEEYGYIKRMSIDILGEDNIRFIAELVSGKVINADSEESLRNSLGEIDWERMAAEAQSSGTKIDYSI